MFYKSRLTKKLNFYRPRRAETYDIENKLTLATFGVRFTKLREHKVRYMLIRSNNKIRGGLDKILPDPFEKELP